MAKRDIVNEIHRYSRLNFERRKYSMRGIFNTIQADLIDMQQFQKENRGYRYILIVIDVFSKKAYAQPLKDKTAKSVTNSMEIIFKQINHRIRNLHTDFGREFYNSSLKRLLEQYGNINHYSTFSIKKASIVERLIRTIKRKIYMELTFNISNKWYTILQDIIDNYNNTR